MQSYHHLHCTKGSSWATPPSWSAHVLSSGDSCCNGQVPSLVLILVHENRNDQRGKKNIKWTFLIVHRWQSIPTSPKGAWKYFLLVGCCYRHARTRVELGMWQRCGMCSCTVHLPLLKVLPCSVTYRETRQMCILFMTAFYSLTCKNM